MSKNRRCGFTLVEVLIVVTIMAILAATIIPQFTSSADEARQSQLDFNLRTLQSQVHLFHLQHNGLYPNVLTKLTEKTDLDGAINTGGPFGPYLVGGQLPKNPNTQSNMETASTTGSENLGGGWLYDKATGQVWADE
jgi:general secretion pathway protein G